MLWLILLSFAGAALAPFLHGALRWGAALALALIPLGGVAWVVAHVPTGADVTLVRNAAWVPDLAVNLAFRLDGLSATFALLINGIGAAILIYAGGYMRDDPKLARLLAYLLLFLGSMLGVVLADDIFLLFVFWELTSVSSYLLIGFKHEKEAARDSARQALLVTGIGGLALLAALILLSIAAVQQGAAPADATRLSTLLSLDLTDHAFFVPALLLIFLGAMAKSAQMPLHFWLPNAMAAPTPVSAFLHSATMVKAGVYLLARLQPAFGETQLWHAVLTTVGAVTMLVAAVMAAGQYDLKRILAYTTISVLGTLTMLIGLGTTLALKAMVVYLVAHAAYKAALFMIAGSIEHATGTRDVRELGGLVRLMPVTAMAGILAALSMAGAPPLFGFIGKELLLKTKLDLETLGVVLILVATAANIFLIAMALIVTVTPFFGRRTPAVEIAHRPPTLMLLGPVALAIAGLFVGISPDEFDRTFGTAMASAVAGAPIEMKLKLWHGFSPVALTALAISTVTLIAGFLTFLALRRWLTRASQVIRRLGRIGPERAYRLGFDNVFVVAARVTGAIQTGSLRHYVLATLMVLIAASAVPLLQCFRTDLISRLPIVWYEVVLVTLIVLGALGAILSPSRLAAIAMLGMSGLLIALLFAIFSAPDLAMTQILVETLTVILLVLVFYRLPMFRKLRPGRARIRDAAVAIAGGLVMTGLVLASLTIELPPALSEELARLSKPEGYGRNVVNVILVDFRALDTLGEITVVTVAGLGVYALLKMRRRRVRESP